MSQLGCYTSYKIGEAKFSSYVLGNSLREVTSKVKIRNIGEEILSQVSVLKKRIPFYTDISDKEFVLKIDEIIHTVCFLSFVLLKAGKITLEEVLGDLGIIHELSHIKHLGKRAIDIQNIRILMASFTEKAKELGF